MKQFALLALALFVGSVSCRPRTSKIKEITNFTLTCDEATYQFENNIADYILAIEDLNETCPSLHIDVPQEPPTRPKDDFKGEADVTGWELRDESDYNDINDVLTRFTSNALEEKTIIVPVNSVRVNSIRLQGATTVPETGHPVQVSPECRDKQDHINRYNAILWKALDDYNGRSCRWENYGKDKKTIVDWPACTSPCKAGDTGCVRCRSEITSVPGHDGVITCSAELDAAIQVKKWCGITGVKCGFDRTTFPDKKAVFKDGKSTGITCDKLEVSPTALPSHSGNMDIYSDINSMEETKKTDFSFNTNLEVEKFGLTFKAGTTATKSLSLKGTAGVGVDYIAFEGHPLLILDVRQAVEQEDEVGQGKCLNPVFYKPTMNIPMGNLCQTVGNDLMTFACYGQDADITTTNQGSTFSYGVSFMGMGFDNSSSVEFEGIGIISRFGRSADFRGAGKTLDGIKDQCASWLSLFMKVKLDVAIIRNPEPFELKGKKSVNTGGIRCTFHNLKEFWIGDATLEILPGRPIEKAADAKRSDAVKVELRFKRKVDPFLQIFEGENVYFLLPGDLSTPIREGLQSGNFHPEAVLDLLNSAAKIRGEQRSKGQFGTADEWDIKECSLGK